ncbi:MAG: hypothetical protein DI538_13440 [Azospira oryzae]|nr:MAG: hypothetical protein DI538_13440 [Azospira oryzae]
MSRSKKLFLVLCGLFMCMVGYISYDMGSRTTFPGSRSQLKERLKKQYMTQDSLPKDTLPAVHR